MTPEGVAPPPGNLGDRLPDGARLRWTGVLRGALASVRRSRTRQNAIANLVGRGLSALLAFAFIPSYVRILGVEAYGLVGFFSTLQAVFALLDMGLSTTLSRELARLSAREGTATQQRDLVRTMEVLYWGLAITIGLSIALLAPLITHRWISVQQLPQSEVQHAVFMMGLVVAFQFPFTLYQGGFIGLQRHVLLNIFIAIGGILRFAAVVPVIRLYPVAHAFFTWQLFASGLQTLAIAFALWYILPAAPGAPRYRAELLHRLWRFAAGMTGISVTVVILVQMDKVLLSKLLPLNRFGYYALASSVAGGLFMVITPLFSAVFPRLAQLVASGDERGLRHLYHSASQWMSIILLPVAVTLAMFPREVVLAWTRDPVIADNTQWLVRLLVIGTALNGLMTIPYALQIAAGWTRLPIVSNVIAISVLVPAILVLTRRYGAVGAASVWVVLNAAYVLIALNVMHRRLLRGEAAAWYIHDVGRPLLGAIGVVAAARWLIPVDWFHSGVALPIFALLVAAALTAAAMTSPITQNILRERHAARVV
jgi:O-antigen/teichoic acid export membrane protein